MFFPPHNYTVKTTLQLEEEKKQHKLQLEAKTNFGILGSQWDRPFG